MLDRFKLTQRVWAVVVAYWLVFIVAMVTGFTGMKSARDALQYVHDERMQTAVAVATMRRGYLINRMEMLLMFQHAPESALAAIHDHPLSMHTDNIGKLKADNDEAQKRVFGRQVSAEEQALLDNMSNTRKAWQAKRDQVMAEVQKGNFSPAVMNTFLVAGRTEGRPMKKP